MNARPRLAHTASLTASLMALLLALPARAVTVPAGYEAQAAATGLSFVTSLAFDSNGTLFVGEASPFTGTGRVLRLADLDGDGVFETVTEHAAGFGLVTGLAFRGNGFTQGRATRAGGGGPQTDLERIRRGQFRGQSLPLFVSHFTPGPGGGGGITRLGDRNGDGVVDSRADIVTGLPSDGLNGNQQIAVGPDGWLYFGQGARTNAGVPIMGPPDAPENGTIMRVREDGSGLAVYARGMRNPYDLAFTPEGELFATENGPDPSGPGPVAGAPDELNAIVAGSHYGWPNITGFPAEGTGTVGPIALFGASTSTDGLALSTSPTFCGWQDGLFAAQFGSFSDPGIGRRVVFIRFMGRRALVVDEFATDMGRPLDVAVGPDGNLYVADFSDAFFSPGSATLWRIQPVDADADGTPDACE